jgi:hypothetical protein
MCLITEQTKAKTAKEDITCYKLVRIIAGKIHSPFFYHIWTENEIYKCKLEVEKNIFFMGATTFDGIVREKYNSMWKMNMTNLLSPNYKLNEVSSGFHAALTVKRFDTEDIRNNYASDFFQIAECVIPKGSKYFTDETDLIVSNQIKLTKIL